MHDNPLFLQFILGFKRGKVALGIFANLTTLARPTTDTGTKSTALVKKFFFYETLTSTAIYLMLSIVTIVLAITRDQEQWAAWTCLGLVGLHISITQAYLWTPSGTAWLFPTLRSQTSQHPVEEQPDVVDQAATQKPSVKKKLKIVDWTFLFISATITLGLLVFIGHQLLPKGDLCTLVKLTR